MKNIVFVLPWVFLMLLSLATSWIYPQILPEFNLEGLVNVLPGKTLMQSIALSLFAGVFSTSIGFFLAKREKPSIWTFLPYFVAPVILGAGLHYFFILLGLSGTYPGVFFGQILILSPFAFLFFSPFWTGRWKMLESTSIALGASPFYTFKKVLLPMSILPILTCLFQCFLYSWFDYGLTSIIGEGKVKTMTIFVFQSMKEGNLFAAAKASFLLTLPPLILFWINKKFIFTQIGS